MPAQHDTAYFVRINGKVLGPFPFSQLQSLRDRGRLRPDHEVSTDRARWKPASSLNELFPQAAQSMALDAEDTFTQFVQETSSPGGDWMFEIDGNQQGPVTTAQLRAMLASGRVVAENRVWRSGLDDWQPAGSVPELAAAATGSRKKRTRPDDGIMVDSETGLWPGLLEAIRGRFPPSELERICRSLIGLGNLATTIAAILIMAFWGVQAVRLDRISTAAFAVGGGVGLAVMQYVGRRMSLAAHNLVRASNYRLSSNAFPSSIAVVLLLLGLVSAAAIVFSFGRNDSNSELAVSIVGAVQVLGVFAYAACAALQPEWLKIDCSSPVSAGEEGVGIVAVLMKVVLRGIPIAYGLFALGGCVASAIALLLIIIDRKELFTAMQIESLAVGSIAYAVLAPVVFYPLAALTSTGLDLYQAIFSLANGRREPAPNEAA